MVGLVRTDTKKAKAPSRKDRAPCSLLLIPSKVIPRYLATGFSTGECGVEIFAFGGLAGWLGWLSMNRNVQATQIYNIWEFLISSQLFQQKAYQS